METIEIKKSHIVAAYLIATAYFMGGVAAVGPYACPNDHGWQRVALTMFGGVIWPLAAATTTLGYTSHDTKCVSGDLYQDPPKSR